MSERVVGVRELRNRLSEYLRRVKAGEMITITEHGKEIGRIIPAEPALEDILPALIQAGIVAWSGEKLEQYQPAARNRGQQQVADLLVALRE